MLSTVNSFNSVRDNTNNTFSTVNVVYNSISFNFSNNTYTNANIVSITDQTNSVINYDKDIYGSYCLTLNGTSQYGSLSLASYYAYNVGTVELWINASAVQNSYTAAILTKPTAYGIYLFNGILSVYDWYANLVVSTGIALNDNTWHHIAFSFNSGVNNGSFIYVDKILKNTFTYTVLGQTVPITLGSEGTSSYFKGKIYQLRIWNRQLSSVEIAILYNRVVSPQKNGLAGYWQFTDGSGSTLTNSVSGGYNINLVNSPTWTPINSPGWSIYYFNAKTLNPLTGYIFKVLLNTGKILYTPYVKTYKL